MPLIAVAVAIGATALAATSVAATVGGIMAISMVTAMEIVAAVGATISAIGAVTRDKDLTMAGGIIGVIGGIGGLAAGAGVLGAEAASGASIFGASPAASTAETAGDVAGSVAGDAEAIAAAGDVGPGAGIGVSEAATSAAPDTIGFVTGMNASPPSEGITNLASTSENAADPGLTLAEKSAAGIDPTTNSILNSQLATATDMIAPPPQPPNNLGAVDPNTGETIASAVDPTTGKIVDMPSLPDKPGIFSSLLDFAGKHPVAVLGALQTGGSFLSGSTSTLTPAQVAALNAQAAANQAAAALSSQQRANLAMPKAVASSAPVTGAPAQLVPGYSQTGFINQPPRTAVTGAAA